MSKAGLNSVSRQCSVLSLPHELRVRILQNLNLQDQASAGRCCRSLAEAAAFLLYRDIRCKACNALLFKPRSVSLGLAIAFCMHNDDQESMRCSHALHSSTFLHTPVQYLHGSFDVLHAG